MGRRSINTTKSGKYMNPTDQARKEARKQELKKNKKQRQMVRAAVLKGKDPQQILEEMEKIDQMEYNVHQPSPLNEKVLKDKRKKLRDTLDRVLSMYYKDDPDKWTDLKRKQGDYEHKRNQMISFYESVRSAQQVQVDEIPLPLLPQQAVNAAAQIPLPTERKQEHTIYSIATALKLQALGQPVREPPGCPPGPPPIITDDGEVDDFVVNDETDEVIDDDKKQSRENVDEFMKELDILDAEEIRPKPTINEPIVPPGTDLPPTPLLYPGPPLRLPPGPPPGRPLLPPGPPPGLPPPRLPIRLPTAPPRMIRLPVPPPTGGLSLATPNVLSAAPQLIGRIDPTKSATICAKPQIRNLSADVTRFVPSALRVKREDRKQKPNSRALHELKQKEEFQLHKNVHGEQHTKDDAYKQFMQEMQNLL